MGSIIGIKTEIGFKRHTCVWNQINLPIKIEVFNLVERDVDIYMCATGSCTSFKFISELISPSRVIDKG